MNIRQQGNGERVWTGNPHTKKENDEHTNTHTNVQFYYEKEIQIKI